MSSHYKHAPIDEKSAEWLAARGLRLGLVDTDDTEAFGAWLYAVDRGFHSEPASEEKTATDIRQRAFRRTIGVWDPTTSTDADVPVATSSSWPAELTVPGHASVTGWAISAVSVAATHRRRGIGRQMLEAELRTAAALNVPVAILTVSEATIYSRYGFAPAAFVADWTIDTGRATWSSEAVSGRIQFARPEQLAPEARELVERTRLDRPGDIHAIGHLWERVGVYDSESAAKDVRCVRYDDAAGRLQGFAVYRFTPSHDTVALEVHYLHAATRDAYSGLWRFLLEVDLVSEVTAPLRSVDESFVWQLSDRRAARKSNERDHLWLRILDLKASLEARRYGVPGRLVLEVDDPLGFAAGRVLLDVASDGTATLTPLDGSAPDGLAAVAMGVNELAALYLGGVSAVLLARAGRVTELTEAAAATVDLMFRSPVAPWLSIRF